MATNRFTITATIGPYSFSMAPNSATIGGNEQVPPTSIAAAKTGTLSTRTNDTSGTLTMTTGHGFTTGQKDISIFWSGGSRRNVLVGTVATNSVPFSGGTGDNLPLATTAITAMAPTVNTSISGNMATAIDYGLTTTTNTEEYIIFSFGVTSGGNYTENAAVTLNAGIWGTCAMYDSVYIGSNALAAATAYNTIKMSHGDSTQAVVVNASISYAV